MKRDLSSELDWSPVAPLWGDWRFLQTRSRTFVLVFGESSDGFMGVLPPARVIEAQPREPSHWSWCHPLAWMGYHEQSSHHLVFGCVEPLGFSRTKPDPHVRATSGEVGDPRGHEPYPGSATRGFTRDRLPFPKILPPENDYPCGTPLAYPHPPFPKSDVSSGVDTGHEQLTVSRTDDVRSAATFRCSFRFSETIIARRPRPLLDSLGPRAAAGKAHSPNAELVRHCKNFLFTLTKD